MSKEIELRYLVDVPSLGARLASGALRVVHQYDITQTYIVTGPVTVRVRHSDEGYMLNIKTPGDSVMVRNEYEWSIPEEDAKDLMAGSSSNTITKHRLVVKEIDGRQWEVDTFSGKLLGLTIAELELDSEDDFITVPTWATREVTYEPSLTNAALSLLSAEQAGDLVNHLTHQ